MRVAPALDTACDTADADSQPGTSTSVGSSGTTSTATGLPLPLYHNDKTTFLLGKTVHFYFIIRFFTIRNKAELGHT